MLYRDLQTQWELALDPAPCSCDTPPSEFPMTMSLPGTTAQQAIGRYYTGRADGFLTEKYPYEGQIWLRLRVTLSEEELCSAHCFLTLERTRMTRLFVNGKFIGSENSLCTPHVYDLSGKLTPETELILCIKNTDYPVPGGHMTSPDTQTNWIGVTGEVSLTFYQEIYISDLQAYPDAAKRRVTLRGILHGTDLIKGELVSYPHACRESSAPYHIPWPVILQADAEGRFFTHFTFPEHVPLWDEAEGRTVTVFLDLPNGEFGAVTFGLRDFRACGDHFELNGVPVMLRGKHDGMVFPIEGAAPTDTEAWLERFQLLRRWGINHMRFHTCCPPEAAFEAADRAGFFLEPELPFWGTLDAPGGEKYDKAQQDYLIREGLRICKAFANHPSFCMLSLGNELWGSPERLGEIIDTLRAADPRPLYTQGSNNFQHMPLQIPQEDFWTGVRTGKGRLIRGSFATCDAPIGRLQTHAPSTSWDYEEYLAHGTSAQDAAAETGETEIEIQYGTGVKKVRAARTDILYPTVPVVSHEVGQYNVYPDFGEITGYTGVVEARNFEIFRERLEAAGMGDQAEEFFRCSGYLARDCYKAEIEAAMRTPSLAGFQLLDLQDFPGQGTALVGMLNARMENKGLISETDWRAFCGDLVPLALFDSFVLTAGADFTFRCAVRNSRPVLKVQPYRVTLHCGTRLLAEMTGEIPADTFGLNVLSGCTVRIPADYAGDAEIVFAIPGEEIVNRWALTVFPPVSPLPEPSVPVVTTLADAMPLLERGEAVLLLPETVKQAIPGFYCADFWNYHMFNMISRSMDKEPPVGTMGLCMDTAHPVVRAMYGKGYTTPQWYEPLTHADCAVLDAFPAGFRPIVQMIDNVERNHRLGLIFECAVGTGHLLVCTVRFHEKPDDPAMHALYTALVQYAQSKDFAPDTQIDPQMLMNLF